MFHYYKTNLNSELWQLCALTTASMQCRYENLTDADWFSSHHPSTMVSATRVIFIVDKHHYRHRYFISVLFFVLFFFVTFRKPLCLWDL